MKKTALILLVSSILLNAELMKRGEGGVILDDEPSGDKVELYKALNDTLNDEEPKDEEEVRKPAKTSLLPKKRPKSADEVLDDLSGSDLGADDLSIAELDSQEARPAKLKLKNYDVDYVPAFWRYSMLKPGVKSFKKWLKKNKISKTTFKMQLGTATNMKAIIMSALYYDWVKHNPSIAENFYRLMFKNRKKLKIKDKILLADYLMRTGRGDKIHYLYKSSECGAMFKGSTKCYFYLGMDKYIRTGNPKNHYFWVIKPESKMVRRIMAGKEP